MIRKLAIWTLLLLLPVLGMAQETFVHSTDEKIEYAPFLSEDGNTMIWQGQTSTGWGLFESALTNSTWSEPKGIEAINTFGESNFKLIGSPSLNRNCDTLYFAAQYSSGKGDLDLYRSVKEAGVWTIPTPLNELNTSEMEGSPCISPNGKELFFVKQKYDRNGLGCFLIMRCEKTEDSWSKPKSLSSEINFGCEAAPRILNGGTTLVFSSTRRTPSHLDLFVCQRDKKQRWSRPKPLSVINTVDHDTHLSFSKGEMTFALARSNNIYYGITPDSLRISSVMQLDLKFIDEENQTSLTPQVKVISENGTNELDVDKRGNCSTVIYLGKEYELVSNLDGYYPTKITFGSDTKLRGGNIKKTIALKPIKKEVLLNISDAKSHEGLAVNIQITNLDLDETITLDNVIGRDGKYAVNLREGNKYNVEIESLEGYAFSDQTVAVPSLNDQDRTDLPTLSRSWEAIDSPEDVRTFSDEELQAIVFDDVVEYKQLEKEYSIEVAPLEEGLTIELDNIYFEYGSASITESSQKQIDKVVKLMAVNKSLKLSIEAHTDDVGSDSFNLELSNSRAKAIVTKLSNSGADTNRLFAKGLGKSHPVAPNDTEENRAKNRRVEMKVLKN